MKSAAALALCSGPIDGRSVASETREQAPAEFVPKHIVRIATARGWIQRYYHHYET